MIINAIGLIAFLVSCIAYAQFDSLKTKVVTIQSKYSGENCNFLVQYTSPSSTSANAKTVNKMSDELYSKLVSSAYNTKLKYFSGYLLGGASLPNYKFKFLPNHDHVILSTYKECLDLKSQLSCSVSSTKMQKTTDSPYCMITNPNYNPNMPSSSSNQLTIVESCCSVEYGLSDPCYKFDDVKCKYGSSGISIYTPFFENDNGVANDVATQVELSSQDFTNELANVIKMEDVCAPLLANPPYQCTEYEGLSTLSIISQSFSIATGIVGALIVLATMMLAQLKGEFKENDIDDNFKVIIPVNEGEDDDIDASAHMLLSSSNTVEKTDETVTNVPPPKPAKISIMSQDLALTKKHSSISKTLYTDDIDIDIDSHDSHSDDDDDGNEKNTNIFSKGAGSYDNDKIENNTKTDDYGKVSTVSINIADNDEDNNANETYNTKNESDNDAIKSDATKNDDNDKVVAADSTIADNDEDNNANETYNTKNESDDAIKSDATKNDDDDKVVAADSTIVDNDEDNNTNETNNNKPAFSIVIAI